MRAFRTAFSYAVPRYVVVTGHGNKIRAFGIYNTLDAAKMAAADIKGKVLSLEALPRKKL